ncbi:hypothetical protein D9757_006351 [Collybiopsis confluens]|uniref:Ribosomal eL28/Mak16 domain-containing protein n=1 Tax=Collybiopsis confluens TaxID=2823264 RepID=A0A8H5HGE3_9AGAR|nr:hypothetical protein D9757_006351 [Collybiopsis confluens]
MSDDLQWLLLRKSNSYMVKGLPEGPIFSKEPGNLLNIHSHKYSGLANSKTIDVSDANGKITITTRKTKVSPTSVASARSTTSVRSRSGTRRALGVASATAKRGYRPDLRKSRSNSDVPTRHVAIGSRQMLDAVVLARTAALISAQKEPKALPPKKSRGKKAKTAAAA